MRFVSISNIEAQIPQQWIDDSDAALEEVKRAAPEDRKELINGKATIWGGLKALFAAESNGKCWYCESLEIRSDKAIDHFRPKNRIAESKTNDGYWWLAFDWRNFRYSCTWCNSKRRGEETAGGKGDNFPLFLEEQRGIPQLRADELDKRESRKLLDPTKFGEVKLLTFGADGQAMPAVPEKQAREFERATVSIQVYHLNEEKLRAARKEGMILVRNLLFKAEKAMADGNAEDYEYCVAEIARRIRPQAQYSSAARAMLLSLRGREAGIADQILDKM